MQIQNEFDATDDSDDDWASITDLWHSLCEGWRWVVGGMFLGLLVAYLVLQVTPKKWQAIGLVQIGQVGQVGQVGSIPIETPQQVIERIETGAFQIEVAHALKHQAWLKAITATTRGGEAFFTARVPRNSTHIEIKSFGPTPESARQVAEGIVSALSKRHEELIKPTIVRLQSELSITQEKLKAFEESTKPLGKMPSLGSVTDSRFSQAVLLNSMRIGRENEVYSLRQQEVSIKVALSEPTTQPTRVVEAIYVATDPVGPKAGLVLAMGIAGGLILGAAALFIRFRLDRS